VYSTDPDRGSYPNTYGVRLLMPYSDRWFYGTALSIIDPWVWLAEGPAAARVLAAPRFGSPLRREVVRDLDAVDEHGGLASA
jgi:hypothetical protein